MVWYVPHSNAGLSYQGRSLSDWSPKNNSPLRLGITSHSTVVCPDLLQEHLENHRWFGRSPVSSYCGKCRPGPIGIVQKGAKWEMGWRLWDWASSRVEVELQMWCLLYAPYWTQCFYLMEPSQLLGFGEPFCSLYGGGCHLGPYSCSAGFSSVWKLFLLCNSKRFMVVALEVLAAKRPLQSGWSYLLSQQLCCMTSVLRHSGTC